jgi:hypothetical protein
MPGKRIYFLIVFLLWAPAALAQNPGINVQGAVVPNNCVKWVNRALVADAGFGCSGAPGSAITALTGDVTAVGPGSVAATLATVQPGAHTWQAQQTFSAAGAASTPAVQVTGAPFTGGTGTTTTPQLLLQQIGTTGVSTWSTNGTMFGVNAPNGFTGNLIDLHVGGAGTAFFVSNAGNVNAAGTLQGLNMAAGATGFVNFQSRTQLRSSADGLLTLLNNAQTDFGRIMLGGTTSSFPAIKRSSTALQGRLADDSAFTFVQGKLQTDTNYTVGVPIVTGYLTLYDASGTAYKVPACTGC